MERRIALLIALTLAGPAWAGGPIAEVICAPRAEIVKRLEMSFGAHLAGTGIRDAEAVIEIWADPEGDWTLVQTYVTGQSCILAMGEAWDTPLPPPA